MGFINPLKGALWEGTEGRVVELLRRFEDLPADRVHAQVDVFGFRVV